MVKQDLILFTPAGRCVQYISDPLPDMGSVTFSSFLEACGTQNQAAILMRWINSLSFLVIFIGFVDNREKYRILPDLSFKVVMTKTVSSRYLMSLQNT